MKCGRCGCELPMGDLVAPGPCPNCEWQEELWHSEGYYESAGREIDHSDWHFEVGDR